jgi:transposase
VTVVALDRAHLVTIRAAAKMAQVPLRSFYNWIQRGDLKLYPPKPGGRGARVDWRQVDRLINRGQDG